MKIVLGGPPQSGKSCSREGLKQAIRNIPGAPYPYIITGCPDGEGSWFQETVTNSPERAAQLKAAYKANFTPEFVHRVAASVRNCTLPLTLVDIGGIPSSENHEICATATHLVILAGDDPKTGQPWSERILPWREFAAELGLVVVAEIYSDYHGTQDTVPTQCPDGVWRGSVHHLERGEALADRPTIKALGEILVQLAVAGN